MEPASEGTYNPLLQIHPFAKSTNNQSLLATGDDKGGVRIWDERLCGNWSSSSSSNQNINWKGKQRQSNLPPGCVFSWKEHDDYISGLEHSEDGFTVLATSADCRLGVYDLRMPKERINNCNTTNGGNFRLSDDQEDELLSIKIMKNGRKVVCGTQEGVLSVFSYGTWGDVSDRFPGHPNSIDALLKVDEDTMLTGSSDGLIRVVQIQPDKLLGVLGDDHGGFPIEKLHFNSSKNIVGSLTHSNFIRLWDARVLREDDGDEDDDGEENSDDEEESKKEQKKTSRHPPLQQRQQLKQQTSDDEWDDMDEEDHDDDNDEGKESDSDDDDDNDDDDDEPETVNDKRKKRLKSENEKFFDDL
jgi:WD40 repeat protein